MTRRRWLADEFTADRAALTGEHAAHLARILRARVGQEFEVACGDQVRLATVTSVDDDRVEFALGELVTSNDVVSITLLLAIFKFDRMEWAIEKCTELNVTKIMPVIARRTEKHLALAADKRVQRWRRIAREASEQSRRISPPEIADPMKLKDALAPTASTNQSLVISTDNPGYRKETVIPTGAKRSGGTRFLPAAALNLVSDDNRGYRKESVIPTEGFSPSGGTCCPPEGALNIVLAETERQALLSDVLRAYENVDSLTLAIGPEGGWTDDELQLFANSHWTTASLGDTILRAETAAIAALAIARALAHG